MPIINYVLNIPAGTDIISQSQPNLQINCNSVNQWTGIDHLNFADGNAGMHKWVEMPTAGTPGVVAGKIDLYPKFNNVGTFQSARNEIFVQPSGTVAAVLGGAFPMTACSPIANGWAYLPSGLIMQWGSAPTPNGNGSLNPANRIPYPIAFPTTCLSVTVTTVTATADKLVQLINFNAVGFNTYTTRAGQTIDTTAACTFFAIGY
jgi:hypothetical protein